MNQSEHWTKNPKTWLMVIGGFFLLGGIIGMQADGFPSATWILVGTAIGWDPLREKLDAPKWTQWVVVGFIVCWGAYVLYSMIQHHR